MPYFACCYNLRNLGNVNLVAYVHALLADWPALRCDPAAFRTRIRSAVREEMIHAVQVIAARERFLQSPDLRGVYHDAETYYEALLTKIISEVTRNEQGAEVVLSAARLYYEDPSLDSIDQIEEIDQRVHGRPRYLVSELVRQLVQIRMGELTSEEAKGDAWDQRRRFSGPALGTTRHFLDAIAGTLRRAVPHLLVLSPTLHEALQEIEAVVRRVDADGVDGELAA